ncbi:MAG: phage terminase large subunit family protein [Phascolarctobacterium sp.]
MGIGRTARLLKSIFSKSLKTIPKTSVSEWADSYRMLAQGAAEPGRWHTSRAPYQKDIMDAFTAKGVHRVVVKSCSQVGKSDIMNNVIGRFAHLDPCTMMMIQPTLADGEDFSKSRITPMIEATKVLKRIFRESKSRSSSNTIMSKYFTGGRLIIAGANAPSGLASRPIRILLCDEVDRFPDSAGAEGDPVDLAAKRTTTYWNRLIGLFSTPTIKGASRIDDEYMTGTQEEWQHQCPKCKEWHLLTHRQMLADYETSHKQNKKHVFVKKVLWVCPDCGFGFYESEMRNAPQKFIAQNPDAFKTDTRSFFVNCWTSPWLSWDRIMKEWLEAEGDPEREKVVYNTRFGESYERKGNFESEDVFLKRREDYGAELPDGVLILTAAVDVQDNRLEYEVAGWGHGEEHWGIVKGIIMGVPDTDEVWNKLDEQLDKVYYFANGRGLKVARTFIDSGGHYTKYVYSYCLRNYYKQRFAIKGASKPGEPLIAKISKIQVDNRSIPLVLLGTDSGKQYIMDRLSIEVPGAKYMHFPLDKAGPDKADGDLVTEILRNRGYDRIYFRGLISEELVPRKHNGVIVMRWENIAKDRRNEPLDLAVYNLACLQSIRPDFNIMEQLLNTANETVKSVPAQAKKKVIKKSYGCIKRGER